MIPTDACVWENGQTLKSGKYSLDLGKTCNIINTCQHSSSSCRWEFPEVRAPNTHPKNLGSQQWDLARALKQNPQFNSSWWFTTQSASSLLGGNPLPSWAVVASRHCVRGHPCNQRCAGTTGTQQLAFWVHNRISRTVQIEDNTILDKAMPRLIPRNPCSPSLFQMVVWQFEYRGSVCLYDGILLFPEHYLPPRPLSCLGFT